MVRVADDADRVAALFHGADRVFQQLAVMGDARIRCAEEFVGAVGDQALAFLRRAILLVGGEIPPAVLDPFINPALIGAPAFADGGVWAGFGDLGRDRRRSSRTFPR